MVSRSNDLWTFTLEDPEAHAAWLVGDFNNWSTTATPMEQTGDRRWQANVRLPRDRVRYCFFVWRSPRGPGMIVGDDESRPASAPRVSRGRETWSVTPEAQAV